MKVLSCNLVGVQVVKIEIEVMITRGFSGLVLLGLPNDAARDIRERVRANLELLGLDVPSKRILVSIRSDTPLKSFRLPLSHLDFPVAAAVVLAFQKMKQKKNLNETLFSPVVEATPCDFFWGELGLNGDLKPSFGDELFDAFRIQQNGHFKMHLPPSMHPRHRIQKDPWLRFDRFQDWFKMLSNGSFESENVKTTRKETAVSADEISPTVSPCSVSEKNREVEKWMQFLEAYKGKPQFLLPFLVTAVGRHHLLLCGSPGIGKSFSARLIQSLLPPLRDEELPVIKLISEESGIPLRPFRSPHHSSSVAALIGGSSLKPGEATKAHRGVLFLDEFSEFQRNVLESLREGMETKKIELSKSLGSVSYPADFQMIAATNPCACGYLFHSAKACRCDPHQIRKYQAKFSGPILDRFCLYFTMDLFQQSEVQKKIEPLISLLECELKPEKKLIFVKHLMHQQSLKYGPSLEDSMWPKNWATWDKTFCNERERVKIAQLLVTIQKMFPGKWEAPSLWDALDPYRHLSFGVESGALA